MVDPIDDAVISMLEQEGFEVELQRTHVFFVVLTGRALDESDFRQHIEDQLEEMGENMQVTARRTNYNSFIVKLG